jgi:hypothetical protein
MKTPDKKEAHMPTPAEDLHESFLKAVRNPMLTGPGEPIGLETLLEKMVLGAVGVLARRGGKETRAGLPSPTTERLEKSGPLSKWIPPQEKENEAGESIRGAITSALRKGVTVPSRPRSRR